MKKTSLKLSLSFLFYFLLTIGFTSCITIIGLTNDFDKLSDNEKSLIHPFTSSDQLIEGNIYLINAQQLRKELENYEKSMVYCFTNGCSSESCEPINNYIKYSKENGFKLFLVMNGFGNISSTLDQSVNTPYFAIDQAFYNSKYRSKYTRRFENELLGRDIDYKSKEYQGNLFFFEGTKHIETKNSLKRLVPTTAKNQATETSDSIN